ncbi:cation:proton antiporter [Agromyces seonyuensis]|uniref:Sodium:proton antiporter n=1 Tax=Agromyces seonyuensis TaxID=2662446 RepID=A0A6I4P7K6_9MICO|nr:sodium:proton antiporter [Agromyces seonyuensis]MWB99824.1 sodium:proton antiporter [Agromyces seonyuensis]
MQFHELFLLLAGALVVTALARRLGWSAPLSVMTVAFGVSIIPGVPEIEVDGELILALVLPPLVYSAALDVGFLNFRAGFRQIRRLGISLPIVTALAVGFIAWAIMPQLGLPVALLLGAIVSPSDAVSAASIGRALGLPRRVMSVLSGESLVNDATSLTMFKVFAAIAVGTTVTVWQGLGIFALAVAVGLAVGIPVGWAFVAWRRRSRDGLMLTTVGLLVPFATYALAERLAGSGVIAVVAAGIVIGFDAPRTSYETRLQERPVWRSLDLLLEAGVFALIGLQLQPAIADVLDGETSVWRGLGLAVIVLLVVILVRLVWVFGGYGASRWWGRLAGPTLANRRRRYRPEPKLSAGELFVIGWSGMRGVVTLATAASVPLSAAAPGIGGIVFLVAFVVTVGTLLLQGLTLAPIARRLGVHAEDEQQQDRADLVRVLGRSAEAGLAVVEERRPALHDRHGERADRILDAFARRIRRMEQTLRDDVGTTGEASTTAIELDRLTREWIAERRRLVIAERDAGTLDEEVMRELITAIDAEEFALDLGTRIDREARGRDDPESP